MFIKMSDKILRVSNIDAMVNTIKTHVEDLKKAGFDSYIKTKH